jgi:hypothetical protein
LRQMRTKAMVFGQRFTETPLLSELCSSVIAYALGERWLLSQTLNIKHYSSFLACYHRIKREMLCHVGKNLYFCASIANERNDEK